MESTTSVQPFQWHNAFEFQSRRFIAVTISGSQREGICTAAMHGYWQTMMILFEQELLGSHGFSLIPPDRLYVIIFATRSYFFPLFEWQEKERGWYLYAGDYPIGWENKVKVVNLPCL